MSILTLVKERFYLNKYGDHILILKIKIKNIRKTFADQMIIAFCQKEQKHFSDHQLLHTLKKNYYIFKYKD